MAMLKGAVLITGGAGFIGSHLADALSLMEDVERIVVLDDLSSGSIRNLSACEATGKLCFVRGDIRDKELVRNLIEEHGIDYIFHEAAIVGVPISLDDPVATNDVNVNGTLALLEAAMDADVKRLVMASSCVVYGEAENFPISEEEPPRPKSPYGASKLAAEAYWMVFHKAYELKTVALRYFNVYGPRQRGGEYGGVITSFISNVLNGQPPEIYGDGEQTRDFVHVRDVVKANILAAERENAVGEVFNIGSGTETSVNELCELVLKLMGREDMEPVYGPPREGDIRRSWADISKARAVLGYEPEVSLEDGLRELIEVMRASS